MPEKSSNPEKTAQARMHRDASIIRQFPFLLFYPIRGYASFLIPIFSFMLWLTSGNLLGLFAVIMVSSWTLKYGYSILENTAYGYATPPLFNELNSDNYGPLKQFIYILFFVALSYGLAAKISTYASIPVAFFAIYLLPASTIVIATQDDLLLASNPFTLFAIVHRIGFIRYTVLFLLATLTLGCFLLYRITYPSFLSLLLLILAIYLYFLTSHIIGFVVFHKRHELGLHAFVSPEREQEEQLKLELQKISDIVQEIYRLTMTYQPQAAIEELYKQTAKFSNHLEIQKDLFYRILAWEEKQVVLAQGRRYLGLLLDHSIFMEAFRVYQLCWQRNPNFSPPELISEHVLRLAKLAYAYREYEFALVIMKDFAKRYPEHQDRVEINFLTACILHDQFQRTEEALTLLQPLLAEKQHPLFTQINQYSQQVLSGTR